MFAWQLRPRALWQADVVAVEANMESFDCESSGFTTF
jgi:hypothetical protein